MFKVSGWLRIIAVLLSVAALQACSVVKLGYGQLPDLAYWWLDGQVDLSDAQTPRVREALPAVHRWHRQTQLPRYADLLDRLAQQATLSLRPEDICSNAEAVRAAFVPVIERAATDGAWLANNLSPQQIMHLQKHWERGNKDFLEDWVELTPAKREAQRLERNIERAERLYGRLDAAQRSLLQEHLARMPFDAQASYDARLRRQKEMITLLQSARGSSDSAATAQQLRAWGLRALMPTEPADRARIDALTQHGCQGLALLHASTSSSQRARAVEVLRGYERDLRELAAQP